MRRLSIPIFLFLLLLSINSAVIAQDNTVMTLMHDGVERTYHLFIPDDYQYGVPLDLTIALHGSEQSASEMATTTGLRDLANETSRMIIFPEALDGHWSYLDIAVGETDNQDDIGFISALIAEIRRDFPVSGEKTTVIGYSDGGLMALRVRCELNAEISAVGIIGATPTFGLIPYCQDASVAPIATMVILGTNDVIFPWEGFAEIENGQFYNTLSATQTMTFIASINDCPLTPAGNEITAQGSPIRVLVNVFDECGGDNDFEMVALINFAHDYPSEALVTVDDESMTLEAYMWAFLERFINQL